MINEATIGPLVKTVIARGVDNVDVSMLPQEVQDIIFTRASDELFRQGKKIEALAALERGHFNLPEHVLMPIAEYCMITNKYEVAAKIHERLGNPTMAAFLRANFTKR